MAKKAALAESERLGIAFVSAEMAPFAKTGGLGDVAAALPRYLHELGHDVRPFMPLYGVVDRTSAEFEAVKFLQEIPLRVGSYELVYSVFTTALPGTDLPVYFIACAPLYDRLSIYSSEWDEYLRYAFFSRAAIECCQRMGFAPDVFHCNDWHTGLVPIYLKTLYSWDQLFARTKTVLTVHNLAYRGVFPADILREVDLEPHASLVHNDQLRQGIFSFLTTGVLWADVVTAVSNTYAREIQTPEFGMGLDSLLRQRSESVVGIVNGVDYQEWSPETDKLIPHNYSTKDMSGKAKNRHDLLERMRLDPNTDAPVIGMVTRLTSQKGIDLLFETLPRLLSRRDVRFVALGSGAAEYEAFLAMVARAFPDKAAYKRGYDNVLAHHIEAGADMFLMPSRFEPCGLNQMYSLKYGTIPIVRRTGGLADTVEPFDRTTGTGNGILFDHYDAAGMWWALDTAVTLFDDKLSWKRMMQNAMLADFSWEKQITKYVALYRVLGAR